MVRVPTYVIKTVGWVADLCPICHLVSRFKVVRHGIASAYKGIPLGSGRLFRHEATCSGCDWTHPVDLDAYRAVCEHPAADVRELLAYTQPGLVRKEAHRLDQARRIQKGRDLTDEQRHELVRGVFAAAETLARNEETAQNSRFRGGLRTNFVLLPLLLVFGVLGLPLAMDVSADIYTPALVILFAAMLAG